MTKSEKVFIAFGSEPYGAASTIGAGAKRANELSKVVDFHPWTINDIAGQALLSPILTEIENSSYVVVDITKLNFNAVYEAGFAIGRRKRVLLTRNKSFAGDGDLGHVDKLDSQIT